ncbi:hypothetical protein [Leptolyngbya sp. FACHB-17]|uniref:hypothetical protein n=2 Tax=unclassified Leptolyngbya TaxID=2650499 RepID=UPI0019B9B733|nr:hypothetical protein [Leptolyngbya sp. FACHB-17]MBD2081715.1 hypothetical protein [Leptolyngbya sp. FACHB-17]
MGLTISDIDTKMMKQIAVLLKSTTVLGAIFTLSIATPVAAHTPTGTPGYNPGSEKAPPSLPQPGSPAGGRFIEIIGELRAIVSQPAVPPNEPGVEVERPGFVRLDLKREGSTPASIAARFSRYVDRLNTQSGQFTIFGNDRLGVTRNIEVVLIPKLDRQVEIRFTSNSDALKGVDGKPIIQSFTAQNAKIAAILAGVLPALDAAKASLPTMQTAAKIVLSLGNLSLSSTEIQQLAQGLAESLIASEPLLAGCGSDIAAPTCTNISKNSLATAIRAYNNVVLTMREEVLVTLSNNSEFQTLGKVLRQSRNARAKGN